MVFPYRGNFGVIKKNSKQQASGSIWDTFAGTVKDASILRTLDFSFSFFDIKKQDIAPGH